MLRVADQELTDGWGTSDPPDDTLVRSGVMSLADRITAMAKAGESPPASASDPSRPAVLIASDDGRGVCESLSYLPVSRWTIWMTT